MRPIIEDGAVLVADGSGAWMSEYRPAHPHEIVPALLQIIIDLSDRLSDLEAWHKRCVEYLLAYSANSTLQNNSRQGKDHETSRPT